MTRRPAGAATLWVTTIAVLLVCSAALLAAHRAGIAARAAGATEPLATARRAIVVPRRAAVYGRWLRSGVRGRVLVHLGTAFAFGRGGISADELRRAGGTSREQLLGRYRARLSGESFVWLATRTNVVRRIYNVVPRALFERKLRELQRPGAMARQVSSSPHELTVVEQGLRRTLSARLPRLDEPVLLLVDASFFSDVAPADLRAALSRSGLASDLIVLCLAHDDPHVGAAERGRLLAFASGFAERRDDR